MTPMGGGLTGAATGAYFCYNATSGVISGLLEGFKCAVGGGIVGAGLSAIAIPAGMAIDIAISCTFGVLLILMLWVSGRFSLMAVVMGFSSEMLPGVNAFVPGWSILVHRCIKTYNQTQASGGTGRSKLMTALNVASIIPGVGTALAAVKPIVYMATHTASATPSNPVHIPLQTRNFDGIRAAANDNRAPERPSYVQKAA
ncbi:MAG: hypothetical protein JWL87_601 [Candidatus Adlerbacteria bacterium]|nr:hypothetical protein [Candidatus Adlerbacteria bacterium]